MRQEEYWKRCCTGCGLCHSIDDIEMKRDSRGFLEPENELSSRTYVMCPVNSYMEPKNKFNIWGDYKGVYSGYSTDEEIRKKASSGGILTQIAIFLLEEKEVDGIIHTSADEKIPWRTRTVVSTTREECIKHCGSRYGASAPLLHLDELLEDKKRYAFIGKPCDVTALKRYMERNNVLKDKIRFTMSFFCAGVPSEEANELLIESMGCSPDQCISLRYRGDGWPGFATCVDKKGERYQMNYQTAWGNYLGRDVRTICRFCMDGIGEFADISCADLWYLTSNQTPDFSEHEGRNAIFCRTSKAQEILKRAVEKQQICVSNYEKEMEQFHFIQPYQFERRVTMKTRIFVLAMFRRFHPRYHKSILNDADRYANPKMRWKILKGTIRRILDGRI